MRLLLLEDDPKYRALIRHHLTCHWPAVDVVAHGPSAQGTLAPEFLAQGFDAVVLDHACPAGRGIEWLRDLAARPGFAPLVFLSEREDDAAAAEARALGAHAVLARAKIDHERLVQALAEARSRQLQARAAWRRSSDGRDAQRFGGAIVPGCRRIRQLASGLVADLYLAESEPAGALVVVKVTREKHAAERVDRSFQRFLQEHEIVSRVRHPSVVRLHDLGVSHQHAYLVMEYFRAGDLRRRMRAGLTPRQALAAARDIARALEAIHAAGVLHRDLKPGNVMLRDDGSLALIDFGLAKHPEVDLEVTDHGAILGTPHYMSPEQGHGEPIDERSDLYSLGVVLFEMLTGQKPYVAENPMAIIYQHRKAPIPQLPPALQPLQPLLERLLAKAPPQRFASASAAAEAIERCLAEQPAEPAPLA